MEVNPLHQRKCRDCDRRRWIIRKECNAHWKYPTWVLGVHWNKEEGQLVLDLKEGLQDSSLDVLSPTKRDVARITSKIYDPMGFITPVTLKMKLFCQSLCERKMGWDEVLDGTSRKIWTNLLKSHQGATMLLLRCRRAGAVDKPTGFLWCISQCICSCSEGD